MAEDGMGEDLPEVPEEILAAVASTVFAVLKTMYPLKAATNVAELQDVSAAAAADYRTYEPLRRAFGPAEAMEFDIFHLELLRVKRIGPPEVVLQFQTPARLEDCEQPNQVFSTAQCLALIGAPDIRALLYLHGYRLQWRLLKKKPSSLLLM